MSTFDAINHYFSGQGVVLVGGRDPITGNPTGLRALGNVADLKITVATTVLEHKGSQDGQRAIDARLQTETKATLSVVMESFNSKNLALALRGAYTNVPGAAITGETLNGFYGLITGLAHISISAYSLKSGATVLTEYVDGLTPYDYKVNQAAGSIQLNDPSQTGISTVNIGKVPTAVTVGATTTITVPVPTGTVAGQIVGLAGFTGADAAFINGKAVSIVSVTGSTAIVVALNTTGKTITTAGTTRAAFLSSVEPLTMDYTYDSQLLVDSLTQPLNESWLRFEGLNTAETNTPVVVDIFRFSNDPLKELSLISDTFAQFALEGSLLNDATRPTGSKYFSVRKLS